MADDLDGTAHRETYNGFVKLTNAILVALILIVIGMAIGLIGNSLSLGIVFIILGIVGPTIWALVSE